MNMLSPGLLPHPAATTFALDQLEWWQVVGLIFKGHKAARRDQLQHCGELCLGNNMQMPAAWVPIVRTWLWRFLLRHDLAGELSDLLGSFGFWR